MAWNDLNGFGFPSLFLRGYIFQPLLYLTLGLSSAIQGAHLAMLAYAFIGSTAMACTLRKLNFSWQASFLGGVTYSLILWQWIFLLEISHVLPLFALHCLVATYSERQTLLRWIIQVGISAVALLSLHPHYAFIFTIGALLVALGLSFEKSKGNQFSLKKAFIGVTPIIFGLIVASVRIFPFIAYGKLSTRTADFIVDYASGSYINFGYFANYLLPSHSSFGGSFFLTPFIGSILLISACIATASHLRSRLVKGCLLILLISSSLAFENSITLRILHLLPHISLLGDPTRYLIVGTYAFAFLGVYGFDLIGKSSVLSAQKYLSVFSLFIGIAGLFLVILADFNKLSLDTNALNAFNPVAMILSGFLLFPKIQQFFPLEKFRTLLSVVGLLFLFPYFHSLHSSQVAHAEVFQEELPILSLIRSQNARVLPFKPEWISRKTKILLNSEVRTMLGKLQLFPNTNIFSNVKSVGYFDHLRTSRADHVIAFLQGESAHDQSVDVLAEGAKESEIEQFFVRRKRSFDHLGIRYVISGMKLPLGKPVHTEVIQLSAARHGSLVGEDQQNIFVYENTDSFVFPYEAKEINFSEPLAEKAFQDFIYASALDNNVILECEGCSGKSTAQGKEMNIRVVTKTPTFISVSIESDHEGWVVFDTPSLPGWSVQVDEGESTTAIADTLFIAVKVPQGKHDIRLTFSLGELFWDSWKIITGKRMS